MKHDIQMAVLAALMHHKPDYRSPKKLDEAAAIITDFVMAAMKSDGREWRTVPDYPAYEVSRMGLIRRNGQLLKPMKMRSGHQKITLYNGKKHNGISRGFRTQVHRVVALAWIGPQPEGRPLVRHLNGIADDNRVENLAWGTLADNVADRIRHAQLRDPYILHTVERRVRIIRNRDNHLQK